jgi:hypothetical protein
MRAPAAAELTLPPTMDLARPPAMDLTHFGRSDLAHASEVSEKGGSLGKRGRIVGTERSLLLMSSCPGSELAVICCPPACSSPAARLTLASMDGAVLGRPRVAMGRPAREVSGGGGEKNEPAYL